MDKIGEKELLKALESGKVPLRRPGKPLLRQLAAAAEQTFKKDQRINIRISSHDLQGIQSVAVRKGLPYQALIAGLIHQYVEGDLIDRAG
jgi:hypothetical protein